MKRSPAERKFLLSQDLTHALVACQIKKYKEVSDKKLGRTILQKLCYFARAYGVPLPFRFEIYHYGPFSQDVFRVADDLEIDNVILDRSSGSGTSDFVTGPRCEQLLDIFRAQLRGREGRLAAVAKTFSPLDPAQFELVSTIHYVHNSYRGWFMKRPSKEKVLRTVVQIKKARFARQAVSKVYDLLSHARLLA